MVTTSTMQEITNDGRLLTLMNQRENGARRGLIVSGGAATGKTTAIKQVGDSTSCAPAAVTPTPITSRSST